LDFILDFIFYPPVETDCFGRGRDGAHRNTRGASGLIFVSFAYRSLPAQLLGSNAGAVKGNDARCATVTLFFI
jgi:hypothetical protein